MRSAVALFLRDVRQAVERLYSDDGPLMAAATAYYLGLSFFPLLLVLTAGFGWFLRYTNLGQDAQEKVLNTIGAATSPQLEEYVKQALTVVQDKSTISGPLGLATMLLAALAALAQLDAAFDRIWRIPTKGSNSIIARVLRIMLDRGRAFVLLMGLGAVVVAVFLAGMALAAVESHASSVLPLSDWFWNGLQIGVSLVINAAVFTLLFRLLPKAPVLWIDAVYGGLLTASAWEIGRQVLAAVIARSHYTSAYGVIGAFLAVMLWCYYAVTIVLLGAEYIRVISTRGRKNRKR